MEKKHKPIRFRQSLFWDVDPKSIHPQRHAIYIIERILDFGNEREIKWMFSYYPSKLIKKAIGTSQVLNPKSKSLWSLLYG